MTAVAKAEFTPANASKGILRVRKHFQAGKTRSFEARKKTLLAFKKMLDEHEDELAQALYSDLRKPISEGMLTEIEVIRGEIEHMLDHLPTWMADEHVPTPTIALPASSFIKKQPLGVVLVIGPFNYPVQLSLGPLVPALAAGNTAVLKTSEMCPAVSKALATLVPLYLNDVVHVVEGEVEAAQFLLAQPDFDHIFFTGSTRVGRLVMKAAAEHLTPFTLELGGKCPAIVMPSANLKVAAKRIMWSKWINAGQTCIAADYVLIHESIKEEFLMACQEALKVFSEDRKVAESTWFTRIVNEQHTQRLKDLLESATLAGAEIVCGGDVDVGKRFMEPTVLKNVHLDNSIMEEEIFGPILPVISVDSVETAIEIVNDRPKPLALYIFSSKSGEQDQVLNETLSGGVCINDTIFHYTNSDLPFGGVGHSGTGSYHGKAGFDRLSHHRSVMKRRFILDAPQRYPPISPSDQRVLAILLSLRRVNSRTLSRGAYAIAAAIFAAFIAKFMSSRL